MRELSVLIVGGGLAAMEAMFRLRRLAGSTVRTTLICPNSEYVVRGPRIAEPFRPVSIHRSPVAAMAQQAGTVWLQDSIAAVDEERREVFTKGGVIVPYDALLIAVGGRRVSPYQHATTFNDGRATEIYGQVLDQLAAGTARSVAIVAPVGQSWPLPVYELALLTANFIREREIPDTRIDLIVPDPEPLAAFGPPAGLAMRQLLEQAGVRLHTSSLARVQSRHRLLIQPQQELLEPDHIIAMPQLKGPKIVGLSSSDSEGFIFADVYGHARASGRRVFAAGDAVRFPVKHGTISAQQADAAACSIARIRKPRIPARPFQPEILAKIFTGGDPIYMRVRLARGEEMTTVSEQPLWRPARKVVAEEMNEARSRGATA